MSWDFMEDTENVAIAFEGFLEDINNELSQSSYASGYTITGDVNSLSLYCESNPKYDAEFYPTLEFNFVCYEEDKCWVAEPVLTFPQIRWEDLDYHDSLHYWVGDVWTDIARGAQYVGNRIFRPEDYIDYLEEEEYIRNGGTYEQD